MYIESLKNKEWNTINDNLSDNIVFTVFFNERHQTLELTGLCSIFIKIFKINKN